LLCAVFSSAQLGSAENPARPLQRRGFQRAHAAIAFDAGVLVLPGAELCLRAENCTKSRPSLLFSAWPLYRTSEHFAFGAGLTLGFSPKHEVIDLTSSVPRSHSSTFFIAEGTARYLPISGPSFETWLGPTLGFVVVSDSFQIEQNQPDQHFVGENGSSVATEGFAFGAAAGAQWALVPGLKLGGMLRLGYWLLPETPRRTALGDTASLAGGVPFVAAGLTVSYSQQ